MIQLAAWIAAAIFLSCVALFALNGVLGVINEEVQGFKRLNSWQKILMVFAVFFVLGSFVMIFKR